MACLLAKQQFTLQPYTLLIKLHSQDYLVQMAKVVEMLHFRARRASDAIRGHRFTRTRDSKFAF